MPFLNQPVPVGPFASRWRPATIGAATLLAAILWLTALATPAHADGDPSRDIVRAVDVVMTVDPDGTVHVTETYQWDFGDRNGLGFYRELITAQGYDETRVRLYEYGGVAVASPSGAPAEVWFERNWGGLARLAVGAPDGSSDTRTGLQTYVLSYDGAGLLNAVRGDERVGDRDELYTNIFQGISNPMERVTVTVTGPADVVDVACYQGPFGSTDPCTAWAHDGATATLTAADLRVGDGFTISVAWPPSTFDDIAPILVDRDEYGAVPAEPNPVHLALIRANTAVGGAWPWLLAAWLAALAVRAWRRVAAGRDLHFAGLPPGVLPAGWTLDPEGAAAPGATVAGGDTGERDGGGDTGERDGGGDTGERDGGGGAAAGTTTPPGSVSPVRRSPPVTVRFTPPDTLTPAEAGMLESEVASNSLLAATLVDLAARGHLTFETAKADKDGKPTDWRLHRRTGPNRGVLKDFELHVLTNVFGGAREVLLSSLDEKFAARLAEFRQELTRLSDERGFFRRAGLVSGSDHEVADAASASRTARTSCLPGVLWLVAAVLVFVLLIVGSEGGHSLGALVWALAIPVVSYPLVILATAKAAHGRTAVGRALFEQVRGFRLFLTTADANQLRWEEGQDLFSEYLPWAMVFGVAERWTAIFAELAARGAHTPSPSWYAGSPEFGPQLYTDLGRSLTSFSQQAATTFASTPGSSGGSGSFSGGGGSSGGGGGGGGGAGGR